jgi:ubiquinone/menaquinone biosynthesis C-methylase UbiE
MENLSGQFSNLVKEYDQVRPHYPNSIIKSITQLSKKSHPSVLDLGCGTGISTRQLAKQGAWVVGCDIDPVMLSAAISYSQKNTSYALGKAEKLPFQEKQFDVVTAFTSFHWFMNLKAINEIKRVLVSKGAIGIVYPFHINTFDKNHRMLIEQTLKQKFPSKYREIMRLEVFLKQHGFTNIQIKKTTITHKYTLNEWLTLLQSYSIWNYVPVNRRAEILKIFKNHYKQYLKNGFIYDKQEINMTTATLK